MTLPGSCQSNEEFVYDARMMDLCGISAVAAVGSATARERILGVGARLFYTRGLRAVGVFTIIAESGTSKASFYRHFPAREDLILACLAERTMSGAGSFILRPRRPRTRGINWWGCLLPWLSSRPMRTSGVPFSTPLLRPVWERRSRVGPWTIKVGFWGRSMTCPRGACAHDPGRGCDGCRAGSSRAPGPGKPPWACPQSEQ